MSLFTGLEGFCVVEQLQRRGIMPNQAAPTEPGAPTGPVISSISNLTKAEGDVDSITATISSGTNEEGCAIVWSLVDPPDWLSINSSTGEISWEIPAGANTAHTGPLVITVQATNCVSTATTTFTFTVTPVNGVYRGQWTTPPTANQIALNPDLVFKSDSDASIAINGELSFQTSVPDTDILGTWEFAATGNADAQAWIAAPASFTFATVLSEGSPVAGMGTIYASFTANAVEWNVYLATNGNSAGYTTGGGNPIVIA